jgi:nucleotide-binding universal stress UspA family protein
MVSRNDAEEGNAMPKILCCIDNTEASIRAVMAATDLAKTVHARLVLLAVNPLLPGRGGPIYLWPTEYVASLVEEAARRARCWGIREVECIHCRAAKVADAIVAYADEHAIDYIVVGTHDRTGFVRALSGSVSREVIAAANCPVLAVRRLRSEPRTLPKRGLRVPIQAPVPARIAHWS